MATDLANKRAVVTGATTGIGFAIARGLVRAGAHVVFTGQNGDRVAAATRELGENAVGVVADSRSVSDLRQAMVRAKASLGGVDILVANAGVTWPGKIDEVTESAFDDQMD